MFSRIFPLLVAVCVVNASVLSVNVFDEDPKDEVESNPKDCNSQACDQLCRRLKFPGGACVNGRCKCDLFLNIEDEPEAEVLANPRKCRDRPCDWLCRALNNTSGACVDGRCKCTKTLAAEAADTDVEDSVSSRACNNKRCHQICRKQRFRGGACVGANCYCNKFLSQQEVSEDLEDSVTTKRCTQQACNNRCRAFGFREGICTGSRCSCKNFLSTPKDAVDDLEESITIDDNFLSDKFFDTEDEVGSELAEDQNVRGCNPKACDQLCHRLKFTGGACVNGRCQCDNFFGTEDAVDEYSELEERRVCRITKCNQTCTRRGYEGAKCINGRCKCYNKIQKVGEIFETSFQVSESSEDQNDRGCNQRACDQLCRRLKFPGGACFNGRCKCDNFFGTEDAVDEYSELDTRRSCKITKCNRTCTRLGYDSATCVSRRCHCYNKTQTQAEIFETSLPVSELAEDQNERGCNQWACDQLCPGGACVNGRCKCDNYFGTEGESPLNEVTSDVNEESNEILSTNEEELTDASSRACNTPSCNQMCHRLKYAGGLCRFGQCQCY